MAPSGNDAADGLSWATAKQTIQAAVNRTISGDTVLVSNGVYDTGVTMTPGFATSNRVVITNNIAVRSVNGPEVTRIVGLNGGGSPDASANIRCVFITAGSLSGFMLSSGAAPLLFDVPQARSGGGAYAVGASLSNCVISGCTAADGGGVYGGTLDRCVLFGNLAGNGGGAAFATLNNCLITGNSMALNGGGAYSCTLNNCTVAGNSYGGRPLPSKSAGVSACVANNSIIYFNSGNRASNHADGVFNNCCTTPMPTNGAGNISDDPQFADTAISNFHLLVTSPCINAGNNANTPGTTDLDGNARTVNGAVDIGAFEAQVALVSVATNPANGGTVSGGGTYFIGSNAVLTATTNPYWNFVDWNDGNTNSARTVTVPASNITYTANFTQQMATVSVATNPGNGGTVTGGGTFQTGSNIVLSATPNAYWLFTGWNDGDTNPARNITVPASNITYTANFTQQLASILVVASPTNGGTTTGSGTYQTGSNVVISASPNPNWVFLAWNDGNTTPARAVTVPATAITYSAFFRREAPQDFDFDGRSDIAVFTPASGLWRVLASGSGTTQSLFFGYSLTTPLASDYDGDSVADFALFETITTARWHVVQSATAALTSTAFGVKTDVLVPADYDGDGKADIAVYHPAGATWYILKSSGGATNIFGPGGPTELPVPGDFNGDGQYQPTTYHPPTGIWRTRFGLAANIQTQQWGWAASKPVTPQFQINLRYFPTP